jgi:chromosome segregation ATPase
MAKKPTDLSRKWWHDNKVMTLKSTGLGAALGEWEAGWKLCQDKPKRNFAAYNAADEALKNVKKKVAEAKTACNRLLHKDTIAALDAYPALINSAQQDLDQARQQYQGYFDDWKRIRVDCKANMEQGEREMDHLVDKAEQTAKLCTQTAASTKPNKEELVRKSIALARNVLGELTKKQEAINKIHSEARAPKVQAAELPHWGDYPKDLENHFILYQQIEERVISKRADAAGKLQTAIEACGG